MIKLKQDNPAGISIMKYIYKKFPHADFEYTCDMLETANKNLDKIKYLDYIIKKSCEISRFGKIGIVCETEQEKQAIENYISTQVSEKTVFIIKALPLLKPLIEENWEKKPETKSIIRKYLLPLKSNNIDTLVLFSEYFDILQKEFQKKMGKNCKIISGTEIQAEEIINTALKNSENNNIECNNNKIFIVNKNLYTTEKFKHIAQKFFCEGISEKSITVL